MSPPPRPGAAPPGSSDSELSWQELLRTPLSLSLSSDDQPPGGSLDARVLLRLVDQRCRADLRNLQAQAAAASEELAAVRRDSLASIATLAQRWQSQPGLGAFTLAKGVEEARRAAAERVAGAPDLDALSARVAEAAASVRRRASDTGRTLARGWDAGPGAPGGAGAPWDVWRTLDANLRSLELSVREGLDKPRKQQPLPTRRRAAKAAGQQEPAPRGGPAAAPPSVLLPPLAFSPEGVQAALTSLQRTVEKHMPLPPADNPLLDFLRARAAPLALRGPAGEGAGAGRVSQGAASAADDAAGPPPPHPPWHALAPSLPRLHWDSGAASEGLARLLRRRRKLAAEARAWPGGRPLRDPGRRIAIVTTASLPWLTGTSVNPLLRAAYLARDGSRTVTLLLPWLAPSDQQAVHPGRSFASPDEQAAFVRAWVAERVGFAPPLRLTFYPGRWAPDKRSILPVGDITAYVPEEEADVAVLEEPEHLTWYHHGVRWTDKFAHVVGVVHTNYLEYARREEHGAVKEALLRFVNAWVVRAYCHRVVKLSDAVQPLPRAATCFVHGVSPRFLAIGDERAARLRAPRPAPAPAAAAAASAAAASAASAAASAAAPDAAAAASSAAPSPPGGGVYFIGKVVWGKGYTELLQLVEAHTRAHPQGGGGCAAGAAAGAPPPLSVDVFGGGDDLDDVAATAKRRGLPLAFKGPKDHADAALHGYRVFVNPSLSDVVATTTAEALAMGKWVVVARHPSNAFFERHFRNCLAYDSPASFSRHLATAMASEPAPLSAAERETLSWEAATERFLDCAQSPPQGARARRAAAPRRWAEGVADWAAARLHQSLTGVEPLRGLAGAGPRTRDAPPSLEAWRPPPWKGGALDRSN